MSDTRELRQYLHPLTAIILPAGQAVVSAVAAWVTVGSVAWVYQADNPIAAGGVAAGVTFGVSWVLALAWWRARVEAHSECAAHGAQPAEVIYPAEVVRVELSQDNGRVVDFLDWQGDRETLIRAAAYIRERDYETSNLGGAGKPVSRAEGEAVRDWLISNDLAAWCRPDHHTAGWGLLPVGRSAIRRLHHLGISTGIIDPPSPKRPVITEQEIYTRLHTHTNTETGYQQLPAAVYPAGLVVTDDQDLINDLWR